MKKESPAKKISLCAVLAATVVAILAVGSLVDVLDISLALVAGAVVMAVDLEFSEGAAWSVFAVSAALSFLLPGKSAVVLYALFFGWYPLFRKHLTRLPKWLAFLLKLLTFDLLMGAYLFLSLRFFGAESGPVWMLALTAVLANLLFLLYDPALDRLAAVYVLRIRPRLGFRDKK
ncbi:MAG: hypothetical protein II776_01060 [Clostridia bacterium]|nr:hypothetical protein [Clostridia bacterium]